MNSATASSLIDRAAAALRAVRQALAVSRSFFAQATARSPIACASSCTLLCRATCPRALERDLHAESDEFQINNFKERK